MSRNSSCLWVDKAMMPRPCEPGGINWVIFMLCVSKRTARFRPWQKFIIVCHMDGWLAMAKGPRPWPKVLIQQILCCKSQWPTAKVLKPTLRCILTKHIHLTAVNSIAIPSGPLVTTMVSPYIPQTSRYWQ